MRNPKTTDLVLGNIYQEYQGRKYKTKKKYNISHNICVIFAYYISYTKCKSFYLAEVVYFKFLYQIIIVR